LEVREKWNGIERGDGIERGLVLVMNRKRERKCNVEVAVILIYQRERERFVPCDFLEEECDDESLAQRERERESGGGQRLSARFLFPSPVSLSHPPKIQFYL
jgi:hypothetical protein